LNHRTIGHRRVRRLHVYTRTSWSRVSTPDFVSL
ncbi:hypothetical protein T07_2625, partial [Trichinella nelsoni]